MADTKDDLIGVNATELLEAAAAADPTLEEISAGVARKVLRGTMNAMLEKLNEVPVGGVLRVAGLGTFRVSEATREDGQTVRRVMFNPRKVSEE